MSLISEKVQVLRDVATAYESNGLGLILNDAANTIEELSAKLASANMERSTAYYNNGWIPCSERLPDVPEGIEDSECPEFNVTIKGAELATTLKYAPDGTWFNDDGEIYNVIAWQPLPEPYKEV